LAPPDGRPAVLVHGNPTWGYLFLPRTGLEITQNA
jgi:hypothetical protein